MGMLKYTALALLASATVSRQASAAIEMSIGPAPSYAGYLMDFNSMPLGTNSGTFSMPAGTFTLSNAHIVQGSAPTYAKPYQNNTKYTSINANGSVTFNLNRGYHYFGLQWGSVDTYNSLSFYRDNVLLGTIGGLDVIAAAGLIPGNQGAFGTVYANFTSPWRFDKVVARSTGIAFEFDNVRLSTVPLPAALPMFGATLLGVGAFARRRRAQA